MATNSIRVLPKENSNEYRPLTDRVRDNIVHDLLESMVRFPEQSRAERESETARIARKRKVTNLQVGGVRSNLNAGRYGNVSSLLKNFRQSMSSSS